MKRPIVVPLSTMFYIVFWWLALDVVVIVLHLDIGFIKTDPNKAFLEFGHLIIFVFACWWISGRREAA